jgi:ATP-dependent helicase/nuclease subunit A
VPSLTGFLEWAQADNLEIKRAPAAAGETLRVMPVHGSKGLEAPIVILPDCAATRSPLRDNLLRDDQGIVWKQSAGNMPARQSEAVDLAKEKEAQERDRLLYVALTRAEKWLVVAAAGDTGKDGQSWYDKVQTGMQRAGATAHSFEFGDLGADEGLRLTHGDLTSLPWQAAEVVKEAVQPEPEDLDVALPAPPEPFETRSPSDLGGSKALPGAEGDSEEIAMARGTAVHKMLEYLAPLAPDQRPDVIPHLINHLAQDGETQIVADQLDAISDEATAVLNAPELAQFFTSDVLAEVPVTAELPGIGRIHGVIDCLLVTQETVIAVDFKTNRVVPQDVTLTPEGLLRQMGAYAAALKQIYPDRQIETGLLWTAQARYMPLPDSSVTQALGRAVTP